MADIEKIKNDTCGWIGYGLIIVSILKAIPQLRPYLFWIPEELGAVCAGSGATMLAATKPIINVKK